MREYTTVEKIGLIVDRYKSVATDFQDIAVLTAWNKKLACCLFDYAGEIGDLYKRAKAKEFTRRSAYERERLRLIGEGKSAAAAEIEAKAFIDAALFEEISADADYRAGQMQLSAARDVLEALQQHISSIKQEKRLEMIGQGSQG